MTVPHAAYWPATAVVVRGVAATHARGVAWIGWGLVCIPLLSATVAVDLGIAVVRRWAYWRALSVERAVCPAGHVVELYGHFECEQCHLSLADSHAFAPSPCCHATPHAVVCACGRLVLNRIPRWLR